MKSSRARPTESAKKRTPEARDRILQAAEDLFSSRGFENTSTKSIAEAAEVPAGLVFYHFRSKEDLLYAVLERNDLGAAMKTLFPLEMHGADAGKVLQSALVGLLSWIEDHRAWSRLFFQEITSDREGANRFRAQRLAALKLMAEWLERHLVWEDQTFEQAELASHLIGGSLMVAALVDKPKQKQQYVASLLTLLVQGGFPRRAG